MFEIVQNLPWHAENILCMPNYYLFGIFALTRLNHLLTDGIFYPVKEKKSLYGMLCFEWLWHIKMRSLACRSPLLCSQVAYIALKGSYCLFPWKKTGLKCSRHKIQTTFLGQRIVVEWGLTLKAPNSTKVVCFSRLLKCLRSLYGKQCGPRSDCSYSLFWVHAVCFYT